MNSKTRFQNAFEKKPVDRLPMWYGAEPDLTDKLMKLLEVDSYEQLLQKLEVDFRTIRPRYVGPPLQRYADGTFDTMWGIRRGGGFWGIALNEPLAHAEHPDDLDAYDFPKQEWFDVDFTQDDLALVNEYAIIGGQWAPFWHEALELVGLEKMLMDLHQNPDLAVELMKRCLQLSLDVNERLFEKHAKDIDIYWFANDFGTTNGLMINPEIWRKHIKPLQAKLAEQGHKYGMKVAMHSCGDITEILPDLIEIGVQIINPVQITCPRMNPQFLKREYGKDLMFFGAVDYNELLTHGTPQQVAEGVRQMVDCLGQGGGYIVAPSHDLLMGEVPAENMVALYETAKACAPKYER